MDVARCYGKYTPGSGRCGGCEYLVSCQLFTVTEPAMETQLGGQSYDLVQEFAADLADYSRIPGDEPPSETDGERDFAGFLNFLLHLDDYDLGILAEIVAPSQPSARRLSVAQLARVHGISRQGMHRKTLEMARKSPELCSLLKCVLMKIRKARNDFRRGPRRPGQAAAVQPELF